MKSQADTVKPGSSSTMKGLAVVAGAPKVGQLGDMLEFRDNVPSPGVPEKNHVVVRVLAAGIAIDEIHGAEGSFLGYFRFGHSAVSKHAPLVPGVECCGVIEQLGPGVEGFQVGDVVLGSVKVMSTAQGTWAERVMLPVGSKFALKPGHLSPEEALATFLAGDVVVTALEIARPILKKAKAPVIVVVGATGSIGTLMLQAIQHMHPNCASVVAVCSSRNASLAKQFGATRVEAYDTNPHWGKTLSRNADVVIDLVGGPEVERNAAKALKKGGRMVTMCGPDKYVGTTKRSAFGFASWVVRIAGRMFIPCCKHYSYVLGDYNSAKRQHWQALHDAKVWTPTVEMTVDFDDVLAVRRAIHHVRTHRAKGKVCINVSDLDTKHPELNVSD